jgi:hypothetical protein
MTSETLKEPLLIGARVLKNDEALRELRWTAAGAYAAKLVDCHSESLTLIQRSHIPEYQLPAARIRQF